MNKQILNMSDLEREMASVETDAVGEEQDNADQIYRSLDCELNITKIQIPYRDITEYTVGRDYDDMERIQYQNSCNELYRNKIKQIEKYCSNGSLYKGHLNLNGTDYYFMENISADTKIVKTYRDEAWLINVDDRKYSNYVRWWRYPGECDDVQFSRNISLKNRKVLNVDIVLDKGNELFSNITDAYLKKALIRNKSKSSAQSIIQTIQKKQDTIRSLPKEKSFAVQGCAGSGKTMVLLHRLRYLLYNKDICSDEYIFLVPSNGFKTFISEISSDFNINKNNILPYQEYYQEICGKKPKNADASELVFAPEYLEKVYSKAFMQSAYKTVFDSFSKQTEILISFCEDKFNSLLEKEQTLLENKLKEAKTTAINSAVEAVKEIQRFTFTKLGSEFENIQPLIAEIEEKYFQRKREYEIASNPDITITISPDDERILSNEELNEIQHSIDAENLAIEKASIFTVLSHKNKVKKLQSNYQAAYEELVNLLIEEDKAKYAKQAAQLVFVYDNVSISQTESILETLKSIVANANAAINKVQDNLNNIDEYIGEKYISEIHSLTGLIDVSGELADIEKDYIVNLLPAYDFFEENISLGTGLLSKFNKYITTDEDKEFVKTKLPLFTRRTQNQLYAYLNVLLFNACKKQISNDYEIKICDAYKHYWYMDLYCSYLTRPIKPRESKYIFIDEAQDLSASEIELINRINSTTGKPTINLFGDINQMITSHGIKDWSQLEIVPDVYTLDENFRNTNQIVDYCNKNLSMQMTKVGIDMDDVSEYKTIDEAIKGSGSILNNAVFIVKDDYYAADLKALLKKTQITNYEVYTVKSAKGLEFKETFVFDADMSLNEKYISYTRALAKLNVIKSLPQVTDRKSSLIIQGNETEDIQETL